MVVVLGPGKFYGRTLPRPRFYPDPKYNPTRVDPPESVSDPLMSWANEAHWSMGGLNFRRLRLQGRIEGSVSKLRGSGKKSSRFTKEKLDVLDESDCESEEEVAEEVVEDEEEESEGQSDEETVVISKKRKRARRLGDEFDKIAEEKEKRSKVVNGDKENKKGNKKVNTKGKGNEKVEVKGNGEEKKKFVRRVSSRKK